MFLKLAYLPVMVLALTACSQAESSPTPATPSTPTPAQETAVKIAEAAPVDPLVRGAKLYKRCVTCHTLEDGGKHKVGPNLWGIYGLTAGTKDGFAYSSAMKNSGIVWDDATLDGFIENPAKYMPKNRMTYVGLRKAEDRAALLAYLKAETTAP